MNKKHFLLVLAIVSIALVSLSLSAFNHKSSPSKLEAASDFYQRHPDWSVPVPASTIYHLDCFRRTYKLPYAEPPTVHQDASDYYLKLS